jgi:hypothetical protein
MKVLDPDKTDAPCCSNRQMMPTLLIPVQIQGGEIALPMGKGMTGYGVVQAICINCNTEHALLSGPEAFKLVRQKRPEEKIVL